MKTTEFVLQRYDADEGMVFDWKNLEEHMGEDREGNPIQLHLYAKTVFIGDKDSIDNYVEVEAPVVE